MLRKIRDRVWFLLFTISLRDACLELCALATYKEEEAKKLPWRERWAARNWQLVHMLREAEIFQGTRGEHEFWDYLSHVVLCHTPYLARNTKTRQYESFECLHGHDIISRGDIYDLRSHLTTYDQIRLRRRDVQKFLEDIEA